MTASADEETYLYNVHSFLRYMLTILNEYLTISINILLNSWIKSVRRLMDIHFINMLVVLSGYKKMNCCRPWTFFRIGENYIIFWNLIFRISKHRNLLKPESYALVSNNKNKWKTEQIHIAYLTWLTTRNSDWKKLSYKRYKHTRLMSRLILVHTETFRMFHCSNWWERYYL